MQEVQPAGFRSRGRSGLAYLLILVAFTGCTTGTHPIIRYSAGPPVRSCASPTDCNPPEGENLRGYKIPGRKPDSEMPWELFLGNAAHRIIAYMYTVDHPRNLCFYNKDNLVTILKKYKTGDPALLLEHERDLRPDIVDITLQVIFEVKPWNERGLQEARQMLKGYLAALNRAVSSSAPFTPGTGFEGEILVQFDRGQHIWRLTWKTTEPGVVQYRWTRSKEHFDSTRAAHSAAQWVEITEDEMKQYGGWVAQAVEEMVSRRERIVEVGKATGEAIHAVGSFAVGVFSGVLFQRMGVGSQARPPTQGGGKVLPMRVRPSPSAPPAQLPAASGM